MTLEVINPKLYISEKNMEHSSSVYRETFHELYLMTER